MLVQGLNSLHQISERVCISLWHMAYKELFEPIDASISIWCFSSGLEERSTVIVFFALHSRHVILFSFFSAEHCMGEPHRGRVELYLWGAAIGFGRSGHTAICCSLLGWETPGRYSPPAEAQTRIGCYTVFLYRPPRGCGGGAPSDRERWGRLVHGSPALGYSQCQCLTWQIPCDAAGI